MNRREALQQVAWLMGGTLSAPALVGMLDGCSAKPSSKFRPQFLSAAEGALIEEIAEIMIPRTATPGAKDVGVPAFIDTMLRDVYGPSDQHRYRHGLSEFGASAKRDSGRAFLDLDAERRRALVQAAHDSAVAEERRQKAAHEKLLRPFILMTKELCMLGFFTSEAGATQVLQYVAIPGAYRGCIPIAEAGKGKTWAQETSDNF